ncbi:hypothetical protein QVD17_24122 [Tagetes erecta]|uniref:RING-type E3 ubiquitin transferase n=1 Tax=Tagetes erecta TaxID=13708 RepID=A0AAD8NUV0_TARER|nr:hypothetical protein QVD17_24122 [Tagetes erecta]
MGGSSFSSISSSSSSFAIIERTSKTWILLNASPDDQADLILEADFTKGTLKMQHYYQGIYKTLSFDHNKYIRIIFSMENDWALVTHVYDHNAVKIHRELSRGFVRFALKCERMFLNSFTDAVKISRVEKDYVCAICHEESEVGDDVIIATLACEHGYHVECIKKWLMKKFSCPLCRNRVFHNPMRVESVTLSEHVV